MIEEPIPIDAYREANAQEETVLRRRLNGAEADQALLRHRETVDRARRLVALFAASSPSRDPRRLKFIAEVLEMLEALSFGADPTIVGKLGKISRSTLFSSGRHEE
jgi:hypothetical protein